MKTGLQPPHGRLSYLATPYSLYPGGLHRAFADASRIAADLLKAGICVYCPITHTHPIAVYGDIDPLDHSIWLRFEEAMMDACEVMIIAEMDGWQDSNGIAYEIDYFTKQGKPIYQLDPVTMTMRRREQQSAPTLPIFTSHESGSRKDSVRQK